MPSKDVGLRIRVDRGLRDRFIEACCRGRLAPPNGVPGEEWDLGLAVLENAPEGVLYSLAKSFDWRTASPEAIGCEVGDIAGKVTMCLHDRYFDPFGDPAAWIESVTAGCREKLAPLF